MNENKYQNREIDHFINELKITLEKQDKMLESILSQTLKTNGRVNKLEDWRKALVWGFGVLMTISILVVNKLWK